MAVTLRQARQCRSSRNRASKCVATVVASIVIGVVLCSYGQNLFVATGYRQVDFRAKVIMRGVNELAVGSDEASSDLNPKYVSSNYVPGRSPANYDNYRQQQGQRSEGSPALLLVGAVFVATAMMILSSTSSMMTTQGSAVSEALDEAPVSTTKKSVSSVGVEPEMKTTIVSTTESPPAFRVSAQAADTEVAKQVTPLGKDTLVKQALAKVEKAGLDQYEIAALKAALK